MSGKAGGVFLRGLGEFTRESRLGLEFICERLLITDSIYLMDIRLLTFSVPSCVSFGKLLFQNCIHFT